MEVQDERLKFLPMKPGHSCLRPTTAGEATVRKKAERERQERQCQSRGLRHHRKLDIGKDELVPDGRVSLKIGRPQVKIELPPGRKRVQRRANQIRAKVEREMLVAGWVTECE